ncbi:hypothetical protein EB001_01850 [bacterium]|nr:hypothetical protein [bacterium]
MVLFFKSLQPIISTDFPEDIFEPIKNKQSLYKYKVNAGELICKDKTILFCGICRDVSKTLERNILRINRTGRLFKDYNVFIYENDSIDNTIEILNKYQSKNFHFISDTRQDKNYRENLDNGIDPYHAKRCKILADCRNHYMNYIDSVNNVDYICVLDLDVYGGWSYEGIKHGIFTLENSDAHGCVSSYGILSDPLNETTLEEVEKKYYLMYDSLAFRPLNVQSWHMFRLPAFNKINLNRGDDPLEVNSNFGGMAIYKINAIKNKRYDAEQSKGGYVDPDHVILHSHIRKDGYKIILDPSMIVSYSHHRHSQ